MDADVVIVGAGPVGLTLANYLGLYGRTVLVLDARSTLIDFPRGVGMDDECLRAFQGISLVDDVLPHTSPNQVLRFVNSKGQVLLEVDPKEEPYGWPRRSGFIQPLVDRVLLEGLSRFDGVKVLFGHRVIDAVDRGDHVEVRCETPDGAQATFTAKYVCGCDGGSSGIRKSMGVRFEGKSEPTRWLVVDLYDDPLGHPNSYMVCDPRRPHVSIGLPHGVRRFEFMLRDDEFPDGAEIRETDIRQLLSFVVKSGWDGTFAPPRVYVHHARIASAFRRGRVLIAGDAAHLMPVWQGQGYNSGIRDAANLAWKLAAVLDGSAADELLDTYDVERRGHATAMINLSVLTGRVISPRSAAVAWGRDRFAGVLNALPIVRRYVMDMRYKPMPGLDSRATVRPADVTGPSPVGQLMPQPRVRLADGQSVRLDEAMGPWFSVVSWGNDPQRTLSAEALAVCKAIGASFLSVHPPTELTWADQNASLSSKVVGDESGALRRWFDAGRFSTVLVRPDRIVAVAADAGEASNLVCEFSRRSTVGAAPG